MICFTRDEQETRCLGRRFSKKMQSGIVLLLSGNLGSGKTTFVKGLAEGLMIEKPVRSPTFNLLRVYKIKKNKKISLLVHADLYRLKDANEIVDLGLLEFIGDKKTLVAIEWPKKIIPFLKKKKTNARIKRIKFSINGGKRKIIFLKK